MSFEIIAPKRLSSPFNEGPSTPSPINSNAKQSRTESNSPFVTQQHAVLIKNFFLEEEIKNIIDANNDYAEEGEPKNVLKTSFKNGISLNKIAKQKFAGFEISENPIIIGKRNKRQPFHYDYKLTEIWDSNVLNDYRPNKKHITIITCLVDQTNSPIYVKRTSEFIPNGNMNLIDEISKKKLNECKEPNSKEIQIQMKRGDIIVHQEEFTCHAGPKRPENELVMIISLEIGEMTFAGAIKKLNPNNLTVQKLI